MKPKENDLFALAEGIYDQINRKGLCKETQTSVQRLKNSLQAFTFNILDIDDQIVYKDSKKLKIMKNLRKDVAILKPDKGNSVVLVNNVDYYQSLEHLFIDIKKFKQIDRDPTLTQLSTLQKYLRILYNRGELTEEQFKKVHPKNARVARAHALLKIHKTYMNLPKFRAIVGTTSSCYYNVGAYLTELLNPLTQNEFVIKDSFDAANKIRLIPLEVFDETYVLASFDVEYRCSQTYRSKELSIVS